MGERDKQIQVQVRNVRDMLDKSKKQIEMALPKHLSVDRMLRVVMTSVQKNPALLDCDPKSLIGAVIESAQLGLMPDGILGLAYLVPFKKRVTLIPGYRGYIDLAYRSGRVLSFQAHVVYSNDHFDYSFGLTPKLEHRPNREERGKMIAAYAVVHFKDGGHVFEVLEKSDIEAIKAFALSNKQNISDSPWTKHEAEMWRKCPIRRIAKFVPLSPDLQRAASLEDSFDAGIDLDLGEDVFDVPSSDYSVSSPPPEKSFSSALPANVDREKIDEFVKRIAESQRNTIEDVMTAAAKNMPTFLANFKKWEASRQDLTKSEGIVAEFWNLKGAGKDPGWPKYYDKIVQDYTGDKKTTSAWTKEVWEKWGIKCQKMGSPWPPQMREPAPSKAGSSEEEEEPTTCSTCGNLWESGEIHTDFDGNKKYVCETCISDGSPPVNIQQGEQHLRKHFKTALGPNSTSSEWLLDARKKWWNEIKKDPSGWDRQMPDLADNPDDAFKTLSMWWKTLDPKTKEILTD